MSNFPHPNDITQVSSSLTPTFVVGPNTSLCIVHDGTTQD